MVGADMAYEVRTEWTGWTVVEEALTRRMGGRRTGPTRHGRADWAVGGGIGADQ